MLYIMRHGKTDWNEEYRLQGRTDIPLNEDGRLMAEKAGEDYRDVNFDICYCSPLSRARETAELVLKNRNVPIIVDDRLVEMSFGVFEGTQNCYSDPDCLMNVFFQEPQNYKGVENGETMEELFARTGEFLEEVVKPGLKEGKDILIIGHGAMNSSIVCQIKGLALKDFWSQGIKNCELMKLI